MEQTAGRLRFSVVVPAYNEAAYLPDALKALQHQDFTGPYEIIVVDNNSTDGTASIAASYGVTAISEPVAGVCQARQRGAVHARGEILVSTDADTVQASDWLTRIDQQFRRGDDVVAVAGPCRYSNPPWWADFFSRLLFRMVAAVFALTGRVFYISATNTAVRRAAFPGYNPRMTQGGDELDLLRRLRRAGRVVWDPENVVTTSPRRLRQGLLYSFFVSFLTFYVLAYLVNRLSSRPLLGMAPAFRQERRPRSARRPRAFSRSSAGKIGWQVGTRVTWWVGLRLALIATASVGLVRFALPAAAHEFTRLWVAP
jgi:glycosyltransferase involved in cell wall biosynthesis